jgi:hypothetical protein
MEVDNSKYQVFIYGSRTHLPLFFAWHSWVVINKKGSVARWEVLYKKNKERSLGYLHIDDEPPFLGLSIFPLLRKFFRKAKLLGFIEGDSGSLAESVVSFVENSKTTYPYLHRYFLIGPNSNTYTEWILHKFPQWPLKLPWNFIGKDYNKPYENIQ